MESIPKPPDAFRSREQQALVGLLRTAEAVKRTLAQVIEPHGITPQQYNVLRILRGAGPDGLPTLTIGERMIEQTPGVTRLIDRLERKGLVTRTPCPRDRIEASLGPLPQGPPPSLLSDIRRWTRAADRAR